MTPQSTFSVKAHRAKSLVESTLRTVRTRGHGASAAGGRGRSSTTADVRRVALRAKEAFRK
ncbi:hypothetical protein [Streptomyces sp. TR06-5]|uniref:hypothetical protein n=1 Tax=unclassified Streptomyces TaxID=2593676 RepID=UPI0039A39AAF